MGDEKTENRALVPAGPVKDIETNGAQEKLVENLLARMDLPPEERQKIFRTEDGILDLAMGLRLADALEKLPKGKEFRERLMLLEEIKDGDLAFKLVSSLLTDVFDREGKFLPEMSEELKRWCVETIKRKLIGLTDVNDLMEVGDIFTRSNPSRTWSGRREIYLTKEEVKEIDEAISSEQRGIMNGGQTTRFEQAGDAWKEKVTES